MKNKFISAIVSAALLFTLAGCSAQGTGTAVAADEATTTSAAQEQEAGTDLVRKPQRWDSRFRPACIRRWRQVLW